MKVLLLEDVYNLGRAGEVKKVANGYGRNYLIPQGLATLATPGALAQVDRIQADADKRRTLLNEEMSVVAEKFTDIQLIFPAKAGETGKLYGSVTTQMIAEKLSEELGTEISKRQIDSQPLRLLGLHTVKARLTIDLIPEFEVVVFREGESPENYMIAAEDLTSGSAGQEETGVEIPEVEDEAIAEAEADLETEVAEEAAAVEGDEAEAVVEEETAPEAVEVVEEAEEDTEETE